MRSKLTGSASRRFLFECDAAGSLQVGVSIPGISASNVRTEDPHPVAKRGGRALSGVGEPGHWNRQTRRSPHPGPPIDRRGVPRHTDVKKPRWGGCPPISSGRQTRPLLSQRRFQNSQPYGRRQAGICKPGRLWRLCRSRPRMHSYIGSFWSDSQSFGSIRPSTFNKTTTIPRDVSQQNHRT